MNRYLSEQGYAGALVTVKTKHVNMKTHVVDIVVEVDHWQNLYGPRYRV